MWAVGRVNEVDVVEDEVAARLVGDADLFEAVAVEERPPEVSIVDRVALLRDLPVVRVGRFCLEHNIAAVVVVIDVVDRDVLGRGIDAVADVDRTDDVAVLVDDQLGVRPRRDHDISVPLDETVLCVHARIGRESSLRKQRQVKPGARVQVARAADARRDVEHGAGVGIDQRVQVRAAQRPFVLRRDERNRQSVRVAIDAAPLRIIGGEDEMACLHIDAASAADLRVWNRRGCRG